MGKIPAFIEPLLPRRVAYKIVPLIIFINVPVLLGVALGLSIPLILFFSLALSLLASLLTLSFLKPIEKLRQETQILARGGFDHRLDLTGNDETGELAYNLNKITKTVSETLQKTFSEKDQMLKERNMFSAVVSGLTDGVLVLNSFKQIAYVNKTAEKITGYSFSEVFGKPLDELITFSDQAGKKFSCEEYCPMALPDGSLILSYTFPFIVTLAGKDNRKIPAKVTISEVAEGIQESLRWVITFHDLEAEKKRESEQIDIISMAAHELRTPLTSVIGYLRVLKDEIKDRLSDQENMFFGRVLSSSQQLSFLVDNLLNFSRIERGVLTVNSRPIDWEKTVAQVVDNFQLQASQKKITLKLIKPPSLPPVLADEMRINEVLNNLINNGITYTQNGGVVEVTLEDRDGEIITTVKDSGPGISEEVIPHLFTKFFKNPQNKDGVAASKGNGLGLYLSKSIVEMHHGRTWVESSLGQGSAFHFSLPKAKLPA